MGLKKSLLNGIVAFVVATLAARAVGGDGTKTGLMTGSSVAIASLLSGGSDSTEIEFEDDAAAE
ncbi:hypothetical protein [Halorussus ruber]|uniref:hypothetical protein n=1 Tax=Halorussus ruber TaxID=1126238 RepID=UPI001091D7F5|nr:hypothetical protein [Halorussus ruber]